ncbi:MAG: phosphoglycerate dehydrogenase [Balneolales bacterium]
MSYKVLLLDGVDAVCKEIFESRGYEVLDAPKLKGDELYKTIGDYNAVVVRSATKVNAELLAHADKLQVIGRAGVGVDNIDIDAATKKGALVMNTPDGNTISTAEHTCGMILSMARNIPNAVDSLKRGQWDRKKYTGTEVHGKKLGIIGLGKIGSNVASRMAAFGMTILAYDPFTTRERAEELGAKLMDIDEILAESDFLTVHTPLTEKTKGLISKKNAAKIKKGMCLVNCARGGIFEEDDLVELIDNGVIKSVALDVYSQEPPSESLYEILKNPAVVCTPHLGASTTEAQGKVAVQIAEQIADALEKKEFKGSLNGKSIALSTNAEVQPFLQLAERLGRFISQLAPQHTNELEISYTGTCAKHADVLTDSVLRGFLDRNVEDTINLINARFHAKEHGLKIKETISDKTATFSDLITINLGDSADYKKVSATVFGSDDYRIVNIDGYSIEIDLTGEILIYRNVDKPGMLAAASSLLAKNQINIASLSLGRNQKNAQAITAITVDKILSDDDAKEIREMEGIEKLHYISMTNGH